MAMTSRQRSLGQRSEGANRATREQQARGKGSSDEVLIPLGGTERDAAGWVAYGGVLMLILGAMYVAFAVIAISFHEWSVWADRAVLLLEPYAWGWIHLGVGAVVALAGVGVLAGSARGRRLGSVVVASAMLISFLALSAFPLWAIVKMVLGALILYCLVARGSSWGRQHPEICRQV